MRTLTLDDTKYLLGNGHESSPQQLCHAQASLFNGLKAKSDTVLVEAMTEVRQTRHDNRCPSIIHCRRAGILHMRYLCSGYISKPRPASITGFIFSYTILLPPTDGPMWRFMLSKIKTSIEFNDIAYCCISLWSQSCPIFGYNILLPQRILKKSYKLLDFSFVIHFIPVMFYTW